MKIKSLFAFIAVSLAACSSDDSTPVDSFSGNLKEVKTMQEGVVTEKIIFENDRIKERYIYDGEQILVENIFTYNNAGFLTGRYAETIDGISLQQNITYDNSGRISSIVNSYSTGATNLNNTRTFNYSVPNKIIETIQGQGDPEQKTYDLNGNGLVYKITSSVTPDFNEATYEGNNLTSIIRTTYENGNEVTSASTFIYNTTDEVKGAFNSFAVNQFGTVKSNAAVYNSWFANFKENYIDGATEAGESASYEYEFNEHGYPVKVVRTEGVEETETIITYQ
jgi:hypothetical protein